MCHGFVGFAVNHFFCQFPNLLSGMCVPTVPILPEEMNGVDPAIRYCAANHPGGKAAFRTVDMLKAAGRPPVGQYNFFPPQLVAAAQQPATQAMQ